MDKEQDIRNLAAGAQEPIRSKLFEYVRLRGQFAVLTGLSDPNEAFLLDVLAIEDPSRRREAAVVARRMRRLARETFPRL